MLLHCDVMQLFSDDGLPFDQEGFCHFRNQSHRFFHLYKRGIGMVTDTELKIRGVRALIECLGEVEAERFISLMTREPFD